MAQIRLKQLGGLNGLAKKPVQVIFTTSKTYTIPSGYKSMDVFVVGGGSGASKSDTVSSSAGVNSVRGGRGGNAGFTTKSLNISVNKNTLNVVIGSGSQATDNNNGAPNVGGSTTVSFSSTTIEAKGGSAVFESPRYKGGSGAGALSLSYASSRFPAVNGANGGSDGNNGSATAQSDRYGLGQGSTTKAFGEANGTIYAGGGGSGAIGGKSGSTATGGNGGNGGGGNGGNSYRDSGIGTAGATNTGGGGGGGGSNTSGSRQNGGNGGSGIAIIRLYPNSRRPSITWNASNTING